MRFYEIYYRLPMLGAEGEPYCTSGQAYAVGCNHSEKIDCKRLMPVYGGKFAIRHQTEGSSLLLVVLI